MGVFLNKKMRFDAAEYRYIKHPPRASNDEYAVLLENGEEIPYKHYI